MRKIDAIEAFLFKKEKFKEKPDFGDKIWDKALALAAQTASEAYHAFGQKKID